MKNARAVRAAALGALLGGLLSVGVLAWAAPPGQDSAPTLVPPTLVPTVESGQIDALPSESAVARIQREGNVRVGILYNEPPFGELNVRGEVSGFDADLARAMAEAWGVEVAFVQVTRQTAIDRLRAGEIDMLLAAQPHRRELDDRVEFSQTYYPGNQMMMVREGDGAAVLAHMENRVVGVVMASRGQQAVADWLTRSGLSVTVREYLTLDQALSALLASEVDGVVENRIRLERAIPGPGLMRFVDEPVSPEPYAIAVRRQDVNMRNLVNRTLQYLTANGTMNEIHQANFADAPYPMDDVTIWIGAEEDAPSPSAFGTDIPFPGQYVVPRLQNERVLRVAGVSDLPEDADESQRRIDALNRSLVEAMASRWQVAVQYLPDSAENALDLVASGQADIAVGVEPDWSEADRVDFTDWYLLHGKRLMVAKDSEINNFAGLRSEWVGYFASEPESADEIRALAEEARALLDVVIVVNEEDAAFGMLVQNNWDAVYGDSLKLIPHVEANPDDVRLTVNENGGWYTRHYLAMAVPRNDIDFRLLVQYTLQELARDGTLPALLRPVMLPDDIPTFDIWPGPSEYLGYDLDGVASA